jgi:hypothetical protein
MRKTVHYMLILVGVAVLLMAPMSAFADRSGISV